MIEVIYEQIWLEDQRSHGVEPILYGDHPLPASGYVVVNPAPSGNASHKFYDKYDIPPAKIDTYNAFTNLEDNFYVNTVSQEHTTVQEQVEFSNFVDAAASTLPMLKAKEYLEQSANTRYQRAIQGKTWNQLLFDLWFGPLFPPDGVVDPNALTAAQTLAPFESPELPGVLLHTINVSAAQQLAAQPVVLSATNAAFSGTNVVVVGTNGIPIPGSPFVTNVSSGTSVTNASPFIQPSALNVPYRQFLAGISNSIHPELHRLVSALVMDGASILVSTRGLNTAFEHIFIGERNADEVTDSYGHIRSKITGYHFWYKYARDQDRLMPTGEFEYDGLRYATALLPAATQTPEMVSISFSMKLTYTNDDSGEHAEYFSHKLQSGMLNGCSPEGLMALATVRFYAGCAQPPETVINGARMRLQCDSDSYFYSFYPEFMGRVDPEPIPDDLTPADPTPPVPIPPAPSPPGPSAPDPLTPTNESTKCHGASAGQIRKIFPLK